MEIPTNCHLNEEEVEQYSLGAVSEQDVNRFEDHILLCEVCQNQVAACDTYVAAIRQASLMLSQVPPRHRRSWSLRWYLPQFAAAALLVFLTLFILRHQPPSPAAWSVNLTAKRGIGSGAKVPPGRKLQLHLDVSGLTPESTFRLEVVDHLGQRAWQGTAAVRDAEVLATIPPRRPGVYFVRAYSSDGKLLREFGFEVFSR